MLKIRSLIFILTVGFITYKLTSKKQKRKLIEKVQYFMQCLVASLVLYWIFFLIIPFILRLMK